MVDKRAGPDHARDGTPDLESVQQSDQMGDGRLHSSRTGGDRLGLVRPAVVVADGHLDGVRVPAGRHAVEITWSSTPVLAAAPVSLVALGLLLVLRRGQARAAAWSHASVTKKPPRSK